MRDHKGGAAAASKLSKLSDFLCSDPRIQSASDEDDEENSSPSTNRMSSASATGYWSDQVVDPMASIEGSPYNMSPWNPASSPFVKSPWIHSSAAVSPLPDDPHASLVGSLVREEGHVYSLAASGDLLYTGSDSNNIRVWKRWREFAGFKSGSGLVKAIVIAGGKIFTGHQDGKIRVWKVSPNNPTVHKRIGTLPRLKDFLKSSINPSNYVEVRRHHNTVWIRHFDAVSCLSLDEEHGILYSGSWDKTVKVWRISDSKCLESVIAHDDAVNAVAAAPGGLLYTGSADGTVKLWRREEQGRGTRHVAVQTMLSQESAVTALAVGAGGAVVYCGSSDGLVNWWERERRLVHRGSLRGHRLAVLCLASAGSLVMSGSADKTVSVWRRELGGVHTRLSVLAGHGGPIKCLAVEEDRETSRDPRWVLYSGSLDRSVRIWRVAERALLPHASPMHVPSPPHMCAPLHVRGPTPAHES